MYSSIETRTLINTANLLLQANLQKTGYKSINEFEYKVFSQWGDDGIIQYLINTIDIPNKTFIEFGVENYTEANTVFLLLNNNWRGLIMDGSTANIKAVKQSELYWKYELTALAEFVTAENINQLIETPGFEKEVGLLHIDIDGNDYWVWKAVTSITPVIVIVEYNSVFGPVNPWTVPYKKDFFRTAAHASNLYYGVSLQSLVDLADEKGYHFIGCNSAGNNAYFIRKDKIGKLRPLSSSEGYAESRFRESRDAKSNLTFLSGNNRLNAIKGMPVYNTRTHLTETI